MTQLRANQTLHCAYATRIRDPLAPVDRALGTRWADVATLKRYTRRLRAALDHDGWQSGAIAIEAALVIPIVVLLLVGIIQFGAIFYVQSNMMSAAQDAARRLAVGAVTVTQAQTYAQNKLVTWGANFNVIAQDPDPGDPNDVKVTIEVPMSEAAIIDLPFSTFGSDLVRVQATMRRE